jgi:ubiquitin carboxyl-terminal hydrolase 36/42
MPADADYLCEYFIASSFNKSNSNKSTNDSAALSQKLAEINSNNTTKSSALASNGADNHFLDSIDFVKYDKNPMDFLKSKYTLLNTNNTSKPAQSNNNNNSSQSEPEKLSKQSLNQQQLDFNWYKLKHIGQGLLNLGNNCYLNATLQCLAYTPPLSQWLITKPHSSAATPCRLKQVKGFCSLCEVERIICDIFNSSGGGCAKPNSLCYNIKKISHVFGVGTQEDASEFFTTLLESMAKSIKFSMTHLSKLHGNNNNSNKKITTIFDDIFSFQFRSRSKK